MWAEAVYDDLKVTTLRLVKIEMRNEGTWSACYGHFGEIPESDIPVLVFMHQSRD